MCDSCGCVSCETCGAPVEEGLCSGCDEKPRDCVCEQLGEKLDYKEDADEDEDFEDEDDEEEEDDDYGDEDEEEDEDYDDEDDEDEDEEEDEEW
jgi:segregation and condensation protein B